MLPWQNLFGLPNTQWHAVIFKDGGLSIQYYARKSQRKISNKFLHQVHAFMVGSLCLVEHPLVKMYLFIFIFFIESSSDHLKQASRKKKTVIKMWTDKEAFFCHNLQEYRLVINVTNRFKQTGHNCPSNAFCC